MLPVGHHVRFGKLRRLHASDGVSESLLGTTVFEGKIYSISYRLGVLDAETSSRMKSNLSFVQNTNQMMEMDR